MSAYRFSLEKNQLVFIEEINSSKWDNLYLSTSLLLINSNEVVSKNVVSNNVEHAFEEAFPAFKKSELFYDFQEGEYNKLSIIKKESFDRLNDCFEFTKLFATTIRLGSSANSFDSKELSPIQLSEYALASLIKKVTHENNLTQAHNDFKNLRFNKRFFEFAKWGSITFFLIGLMLNFHFHEKYRNELNEVKNLAQSYKGIDDKLEKLTTTLNTNKQLVNSDNQSDINRLRFLNNLILKSNHKITFSNYRYQPLKTNFKQGKKVRLDENKLEITGIANNRIDLDYYVNIIRKSNQVKDLVISNINQDSKQIEFELIIHLDNAR